MKLNSTKSPLSLFFVLIIFAFSTQNLYAIVEYSHLEILNQPNEMEQVSKANKKQERKIKKLEKKINKYQQKKEEPNKKGIGLLILGLFFLILGVVLLIASHGAGLSGIGYFIIAIPCIIAGIVLLLVQAFK